MFTVAFIVAPADGDEIETTGGAVSVPAADGAGVTPGESEAPPPQAVNIQAIPITDNKQRPNGRKFTR